MNKTKIAYKICIFISEISFFVGNPVYITVHWIKYYIITIQNLEEKNLNEKIKDDQLDWIYIKITEND